MKLYLFLIVIYFTDMSSGVRNGMALFNNTPSGIQGVLTMHSNPGLGTYLMGQLRNISCFNSTSATKKPKDVARVNNCLLGLTVNTWRNGVQNAQQEWDRDIQMPIMTANRSDTLEGRQQLIQNIMNGSIPRIPNFQQIFGGSFNPFQNLLPLGNPLNNSLNPFTQFNPFNPLNYIRDTNRNSSCANVGDVYNPRRTMVPGPFGFLSPPGIMGNMLVNNGTGSLLMGPLEMLTAGPANIIGLPLTIWMDSLHPQINGTGITMQPGAADRILDCAPIQPLN